MKAKKLDKKFDDNQKDILEDFEPLNLTKRVNVDFPIDVLKDLDKIAKSRGVTRQSLLKMWVYDKIQQEVS